MVNELEIYYKIVGGVGIENYRRFFDWYFQIFYNLGQFIRFICKEFVFVKFIGIDLVFKFFNLNGVVLSFGGYFY